MLKGVPNKQKKTRTHSLDLLGAYERLVLGRLVLRLEADNLHEVLPGLLVVLELGEGLAPAEVGLGTVPILLDHLVACVARLDPIALLQEARGQVQAASLKQLATDFLLLACGEDVKSALKYTNLRFKMIKLILYPEREQPRSS